MNYCCVFGHFNNIRTSMNSGSMFHQPKDAVTKVTKDVSVVVSVIVSVLVATVVVTVAISVVSHSLYNTEVSMQVTSELDVDTLEDVVVDVMVVVDFKPQKRPDRMGMTSYCSEWIPATSSTGILIFKKRINKFMNLIE